MLIDTGKFVRGVPVRTSFRLPPGVECWYLKLGRGAYNPSPAESLAPFYPDYAQRIVALGLQHPPDYAVVQVEGLLELLGSRNGLDIEWDKWKSHVSIPSFTRSQLMVHDIWVSGCRLFFSYSPDGIDGLGARMEVFDFSVQGRKKYMSGRVDEHLPGVRHLSSTGAVAEFPWTTMRDLRGTQSGHDSVGFIHVSVTISRFVRERT